MGTNPRFQLFTSPAEAAASFSAGFSDTLLLGFGGEVPRGVGAARGPFGKAASIGISDAREVMDFPKNILKDTMTPGESAVDCYFDLFANRIGRDSDPSLSCELACGPFRPAALPTRF